MEKAKHMAQGWTKRRSLWQGLAAMALAALMVALAACSRTPPEQRLRERIADMQAALEQRFDSGAVAVARLDHQLDGRLVAQQRVGAGRVPFVSHTVPRS